MKNILKKILLAIFVFIIAINKVDALGKYTVSLSNANVTKGKNVTLYIKATECAGKFDITTSDATVASLSSNYVFADNETKTIQISTINAGTAVITITASDVTDYDNNRITGTKTLKITVSSGNSSSGSGNSSNMVEEKKSSDATLKSLSIENVSINPDFKSDVLEYKAEAEAGTKKVKINAVANDSKANVSGIGEISVSAGTNKLDIIVAAPDGTTKTYKINLTVKEYEPIEVTIKNKKYTVVRNKDDLLDVDLFEDKKIKIGKDEVDGYYNDKLKMYLVGLKDNKGNIQMYIYEPEDDSYKLYKWVTVGGVTLYITKPTKQMSGFKRYSTIIKNTKVDIYKLLKNEEIGLLHGVNVATGNKSYYVYDKEEDTLGRFYNKALDFAQIKYKEENNKLMIIVGVVSVLAVIILVVSLVINKKKKRYR